MEEPNPAGGADSALQIRCRVLSRRPGFGGIASIGDAYDGGMGLCLQRGPGQGVWGEALRSWKLFTAYVADFCVYWKLLWKYSIFIVRYTCVTIVWIARTLWTIKRWQYICVITLENFDQFFEFLHYLSKKKFLNMYEKYPFHLNIL